MFMSEHSAKADTAALLHSCARWYRSWPGCVVTTFGCDHGCLAGQGLFGGAGEPQSYHVLFCAQSALVKSLGQVIPMCQILRRVVITRMEHRLPAAITKTNRAQGVTSWRKQACSDCLCELLLGLWREG